jgi:branched-chain amino acid transport system permease protein
VCTARAWEPPLDAIADFFTTYRSVINFIGINAILGLSLYITLSAGMLSLANAGFMGIGAYTAALLTLRADWPLAAALLAGALLAAVIAVPLGIPVLRLRGVFLAISTIGFGEVVRVVNTNADITKGALGLPNIPSTIQWWQIYGVLAVIVLVFWRLRGSRLGYALAAIKEDEPAARTMGINATFYKVVAFVIGAFIAGLAGGIEAHLVRAIKPGDYDFARAVNILVYAVVGGMESVWGPVLGAALITSIPEVLRADRVRAIEIFGYHIQPGADTLIVNGLVLLAVILFLPRGLVTIFQARPRWPRLPSRGASASKEAET